MSVFMLFVILGLILSYFIAKKAAKPQPRHEIKLEGKGEYAVEVVGESAYQNTLKLLCGGYSSAGHFKGVKAKLVYEESNRYDNKAVRVDINSRPVGYLDKAMARRYREMMLEIGRPGDGVYVDAAIVGGWNRGGDDIGEFGVKLDLPAQLNNSQPE